MKNASKLMCKAALRATPFVTLQASKQELCKYLIGEIVLGAPALLVAQAGQRVRKGLRRRPRLQKHDWESDNTNKLAENEIQKGMRTSEVLTPHAL